MKMRPDMSLVLAQLASTECAGILQAMSSNVDRFAHLATFPAVANGIMSRPKLEGANPRGDHSD